MTHAEQMQLSIVAIATVITVASIVLVPYFYSKRKSRPRTPLYDQAIKNNNNNKK